MNLPTQGHLDRLTGSLFRGPIQLATPTVEDATAAIRRLTLSPADVVTLLHVISANLAAQIPPGRGVCRHPLMPVLELIDQASDDVYEIGGTK